MLPSSGAASALGYVFGALGAEAVPGPSLIDLLQDLDVAEPAARTMLSRLTRAGQLTVQRHGRVAVYRLTGGFRDRFLRLRHADEPIAWHGGYQAIMYDIAESQRREREALRERAAAAGFAAARPGSVESGPLERDARLVHPLLVDQHSALAGHGDESGAGDGKGALGAVHR